MLNAPWRYRKADLIHQTYYHPRFLKVASRTPKAMTIHDMIPERLPDSFRTNPHLAKSEFLRQASLVLCVSEATRNDLLDWMPKLTALVRVTPLGVSSEWWEPDDFNLTRSQPKILFVGARDGYKDFSVLLDAIDRIGGSTVGLTIVGGGPLNHSELLRLSQIPDLRFEHHRSISDDALRRLYRESAVFVFPSRMEGFGLPVLESLAAGTVVVTSDADALVEASQGYSMTFARGHVESLADTLQSALDLPERERVQRISEGIAFAKTQTWQRTVKLTAEAYAEILR